MKHRFLITVASAALIGAGGVAFAQAPAPGGAPNAPAARSAPMERGDTAQPRGAENGMKGGQAERAPDAGKAGNMDGMKSKGASSEMDSKTNSKPGGKAASDMGTDKSKDAMKDGTKADTKSASDSKANDARSGTTTGQAGAGAKLTSEQQTTIRTSITKQNVKPVTNVNFSISIGTRVPRTVTFYPLPTEVVTIYPSWRGYEFFLVGSEIVVVNPRTLEIVAVLPA